MTNAMNKFRELSTSLKADAAALRRDGVYRCCVGSYEHVAAHIDAIVRESEDSVPVAATLDEAAADPALTLDVARELLRDAAAGIRSLAASATPRTEPVEGREAVRGSTLRFGLGAWIVNTGTYAGEPCVFIDDAPTWGKVGERAPDVPQGVKPFIRLLFPTAEQATAVQLALTTPPAGDGACELYAHLLDMLGAKDHEHAARIIAQHHARELGDAARVTDGVALIAAERRRQMDVEGWTPEHDDEHAWGELALAAVCYAMPESGRGHPFPRWWPWDASWWKPSDRIRELVKAGALIAAEIERLQRAAAAREGGA